MCVCVWCACSACVCVCGVCVCACSACVCVWCACSACVWCACSVCVCDVALTPLLLLLYPPTTTIRKSSGLSRSGAVLSRLMYSYTCCHCMMTMTRIPLYSPTLHKHPLWTHPLQCGQLCRHSLTALSWRDSTMSQVSCHFL